MLVLHCQLGIGRISCIQSSFGMAATFFTFAIQIYDFLLVNAKSLAHKLNIDTAGDQMEN